MRRASYIAVLATIGAVAMVLAGASSAAGPRPGHPAAVNSHVRVAGIAVVKQTGLRNYAGPNCPGAGWNCTNATRVLQIATDGGENRASCSEAPDFTSTGVSCDITQSGSNNQAWCLQRTNLEPLSAQTCMITQNGDRNRAVVSQSIDQKDGSEQTASQSATVTQGPAVGGTSARNDSQIIQVVRQKAGPGDDDEDEDSEASSLSAPAAEQTQNAFQSAVVTQTALGAGKNSSDINQSQHQKARNALEQSQNTGLSPLADCAFGAPSNPNACANVAQHSEAGKNKSDLHQSIKANAKTHVEATQRQGSSVGGLEGQVHQDTLTGSSTDSAKQKKDLSLKAPDGSTQSQFDPVRCCGTFSQVGGAGNKEVVDQSSALKAQGDADASQSVNLTGESVSPTGSCVLSQHATINGASTPNSASFSPCPFVILETSCEGGRFTESEESFCIASEPITPCEIECIDRLGSAGFLALRPRG